MYNSDNLDLVINLLMEVKKAKDRRANFPMKTWNEHPTKSYINNLLKTSRRLILDEYEY